MSETENQKPETQQDAVEGSGSTKTKFGRVTLTETILGIIAVIIIVGWIIVLGQDVSHLKKSSWFMPMSFVGALAVAACVILKAFAVRPLHPKVEKHVIPIASLLPLLGFLIWQLSTVTLCLTVGGSIALAYVSATTYWRKHIPEFATNPLDAVVGGKGEAATPKSDSEKNPETDS